MPNKQAYFHLDIVGVTGSNPVVPTISQSLVFCRIQGFFISEK